VSIAHQSATPPLASRARHRGTLHPVRPRRTTLALAKVGGLVALTAFGACLAAGLAFVGFVVLLTSLTG
jgi:hypothetical protein